MGQPKLGFVVGDLNARAVAELEDLPIDSLWVGGHVASRNPTSEAMVGLSRLAALTHRVRIGTSVLLLPLYPPAIIAKQLADLDRATGGRLSIGIGVGGEYPQEFRACQVPLGERGRRTDEAIPLLRRLWTGEEMSHVGAFYAMSDVKIHPAPSQIGGPPLIVAGRRSVAMRRAATLGDGWMPYLYSPRRYAASVAEIRHVAAGAGRPLSDFQWCAFVFVNMNPNRDDAIKQAAAALGGNYQEDFTAMLSSVAVAGTVEDVRLQLQAFLDAGARHLIIAPAGHPDPADMQRQLVEKVLPTLNVPPPPRPLEKSGAGA
jgi:probable F420-dependent oxidoreductase